MEASTAAGDPSPPPPPLPPPPRRWISGLVSGAGRILAAVLDPESSASDTTSSSPDSSQSPPRRDQPAADHGIGKCFPSDSHQLNLSGKEIILKDSGEGSLAIVSEIDPKDAVKQLLMQETYSQSEYDALIKLIQERVLDPDDEPAVILPIAWHANTQQHPVAYSSSPDTAIPAVSDPAYCPVFDNIVEKKRLKKRSDVAEGPCTNSHDRIQRAVKRSYSPGDFFEDARRMPKRNKSDSLRNHGGAAAQHFTSTSCQADWDKCGSGMSYPYSTNQQKMSRVKAEVALDGPVPLEIDMTHLEQKNTLTVRNGSCSVSNKTMLQGDIEAAPSSSMGLQTEKSSRKCSRGFNLQSSIPTKTRSAARRTRRSNNGKTVRPCNEPPQQRNPMAGQESDKGRVQAKRPAGRPRKEWK